MTASARTRLERVRASAANVKLAFQQIEDELAGPIDADVLAGILRELFDEAAPQDGILGSLNQLLTIAGQAASLTPINGDDSLGDLLLVRRFFGSDVLPLWRWRDNSPLAGGDRVGEIRLGPDRMVLALRTDVDGEGDFFWLHSTVGGGVHRCDSRPPVAR